MWFALILKNNPVAMSLVSVAVSSNKTDPRTAAPNSVSPEWEALALETAVFLIDSPH